MGATLAVEALLRNAGGRPVIIRGAKAQGCAAHHMLRRLGLNPVAFIDRDDTYRGKSIYGLPVHTWDSVASLAQWEQHPYIVCASSNYWQEMEQECLAAGLAKVRDFISTNDLCQYNYQIDIMGVCNLRCPSCPRGNFAVQPNSGAMTVDVFERVVDRILAESPGTNQIALYNWGDPLLHPRITDILKVMRSKGVFSVLSSNLSMEVDLEAFVRAKPDWLRVSLSGYRQEVYERTHRRGRIDLVKSNMYRLRHYMDKHRSDMVVEVNFHMYKSNVSGDLDKMRTLCDELGFIFDPTVAFFMPVEKLIDTVNGKMDQTDQSVLSNLLLPIDDVMAIGATVQRDRCTLYDKQIIINWDSSVSLCCVTFDPDTSIVHRNYLETTSAEILNAKANNSICGDCMKAGFHEYYWNLDPVKVDAVIKRETARALAQSGTGT